MTEKRERTEKSKEEREKRLRGITRRMESEGERERMTDGPKEERAGGFSTAAELSI